MDTINNIDTEYYKKLHRLGRLSTAIAMAVFLAVPIVLTLVTGLKVDIANTLKGISGVIVLYGILGIVEFFTYVPLLGPGATYLMFITGNVTNLKMPACISSMMVAGVESNTKEAEIVSTIAVAVSSIVSTAIMVISLLGLSFITPVLQSPSLKPAFDNLMPAIIGALAAPYFIKDIKTASVPSGIALIATLILGYAAFTQLQNLTIPVFILITIGWRYVLYKADKKKEKLNV